MSKKIKLSWYHLAIPIVVILFCPIMLVSFKPHVYPYIVAVPADYAALTSPVSPVFSRAKYFIVYNFQDNSVKTLLNRYANINRGAGLLVAHLLVEQKVGVVIGKNVGPEPFEHLTRRGVRIFTGLAINVEDALFKFRAKQLIQMNGPTGFSKTF